MTEKGSRAVSILIAPLRESLTERSRIMPKSKKPRKAYTPKPVRAPKVLASDINTIKSYVNDAHLAIFMAFPTGKARFDQVDTARIVMNYAITGIHHRRAAFDRKECESALDTFYKAGDALHSVINRAKKLKAQGRNKDLYVFTGDELEAIKDAYQVASDFIFDSLDVCPDACLKEWYTGIRIDLLTSAGKLKGDVGADTVDRVYNDLIKYPTIEWKKWLYKGLTNA